MYLRNRFSIPIIFLIVLLHAIPSFSAKKGDINNDDTVDLIDVVRSLMVTADISQTGVTIDDVDVGNNNLLSHEEAVYGMQAAAGLQGRTFYVDVTVTNDNGDGSSENPKKHIQSAIDLMSNSGGNSVIIKPGVYSHTLDAIIDPPSGVAGNFNTIKAEINGTVIIEGIRNHPDYSYYTDNNLIIMEGTSDDPSYIQFEGLHFKSRTGSKSVGGNHIKFLRTSFEQGPDGNAYVLSIGGSYLLFEDCFFYGVGGRQAFGLYEGDHIILRRGVIRHDLGWNPMGKMEPQGVATIYNSNFVEFQNVILLDSFSDPVHKNWYGGVTFATNGPANTGNTLRGLISMNVEGTVHNFGGYSNINGISIMDEAVFVDSTIGYVGGGMVTMNNAGGNTKDVTIERATVINYNSVVALYGSPGFSADVKNSIAYGVDSPFSGDGNTITQDYNNCNQGDSSSCSGSGTTYYDPTQNGLLYLPRIESGSTLSTAGESGTQIGANIVKRIGVSGTFYGDPGYNITTADPLWPWPYEARIKREMCTDLGVTRGFCDTGNGLYGGAITLTSYIWEALGNSCPVGICP